MGKTALLSALKFLFPPLCWHCNEPAPFSHSLCSACLAFLAPLSSSSDPLITFEGEGPAWTLIQALRSGKAPHLAEGLAGYMALQLLHSHHPLPDFIIPVPQSLFRSLQIGYNPRYLLAHHLGKILNRPVLSLLKRSPQLLRQTQLPLDRRRLLSASHFQWRKPFPLHEKTILLVDDLIGTGATLRCCAQRLNEAFPLKIIKMAAVRQNLIG